MKQPKYILAKMPHVDGDDGVCVGCVFRGNVNPRCDEIKDTPECCQNGVYDKIIILNPEYKEPNEATEVHP